MIRPMLGGALAAVLLVAGCGYDATEVPKPDAPAASSAAPAPEAPDCGDPTQSYAAGRNENGARVELKDRDQLTVGVSADSYLLGSRNPFSGELEGFDIDIARRIASELGVRVTLRVITAADRIELLKSGEIDIVARNMTMNCARWADIAFSAEYYGATQKVLLREDLAAGYKGPQSLAGVRVCAPAGSTSIDNIEAAEPEAEIVSAGGHTGCLVKFQNGEVDAITGDDTVLAGLAAQDPYAEVPDQEPFSDEPYGIGVNAEDRDLVAFVNSVLEEMRGDGSWQKAYDTWLRPYLGAGQQPQPKYGR